MHETELDLPFKNICPLDRPNSCIKYVSGPTCANTVASLYIKVSSDMTCRWWLSDLLTRIALQLFMCPHQAYSHTRPWPPHARRCKCLLLSIPLYCHQQRDRRSALSARLRPNEFSDGEVYRRAARWRPPWPVPPQTPDPHTQLTSALELLS